MRSFYSYEIETLPKLKPNKQVQASPRIQFITTQNNIKGIVGQAIQFYSNNQFIGRRPNKAFESSIRDIIDINFRKKRQQAQNRQYSSMSKCQTSIFNECFLSTRNNHRKTRYFAFQRLVKINSQSYGAYKNWLKQKRKFSPIIVPSNAITKSLFDFQMKKTLTSSQSIQEVNPFTIDEVQQNQKVMIRKSLQKLLKKDLKCDPHQKLPVNKKPACLEQLYVTKTNLIKKNSTTSQHGKKPAIIKYNFQKNKQYKFFLGPGNNHQIIKQVLQKTRGENWVETTKDDTLFNLKWQQYTDKSTYNKLEFSRYKQLINHLQFHEHISTKAGLIQTLRQYSVRNFHGFDVFQTVPITFIFDWSDKSKFLQQLKKFIYFYCQNHPDEQRSLKIQRDFVQVVKNLWKGEKNHPNMTFDKNSLKRLNMSALSSVFKSQNSQYLWLIKPSDYNRGRGIKIFNTLEQMCQIIKQDMPTDTFVIQKYIQSPLLLKQRKFDIRVWVLVSQQNEAYFFQQGYIRTSCQTYNLNQTNKHNQYIHLTNNAVQKNSGKYGMYQEGNQLSFDSIDEIIGRQEGYFKKVWLPEIKRICSLVMQAGIGKITGQQKTKHKLNSAFIKETYRVKAKNDRSPTINVNSLITSNSKIIGDNKNTLKKGTFQLFGFDFMIDRQEKVWLIEVNTNPCLETSSKILQILIPRMIDDAFKIILDPLFKLSVKLEKRLYEVKGYENVYNMWSTLNKPSKW